MASHRLPHTFVRWTKEGYVSQRNSGYKRKPNDFYATPAWVTEVIVPHIASYWKNVWEPAAGSGAMANVLCAAGKHVIGSDVDDKDCPVDFLKVSLPPLKQTGAIVTNPPYGLAKEFIEHALELDVPMVAMLLRIDYDCAKTRAHLFKDCPRFAKKIVLTKRIVWFEHEGKHAAPSFNHAWFVWLRDHKGPPTIEYFVQE
jgi:hypothetical protein